MKFTRTGIILYTINYIACRDFYGNVLNLPILFATHELTCFAFGDSYLMVEKDVPSSHPQNGQQSRVRTCLRMNIPDVKTLAKDLKSKHIQVDYQEHPWGTVAKFYDPDGNTLQPLSKNGLRSKSIASNILPQGCRH